MSFSKQYSSLSVLAQPLPEVGSISLYWKEWLWCSCKKKVMAVAFVHSGSICTAERHYTGFPWQLCQYLSSHVTSSILAPASSAWAKNYSCIVFNMCFDVKCSISLDNKSFQSFSPLPPGGKWLRWLLVHGLILTAFLWPSVTVEWNNFNQMCRKYPPSLPF